MQPKTTLLFLALPLLLLPAGCAGGEASAGDDSSRVERADAPAPSEPELEPAADAQPSEVAWADLDEAAWRERLEPLEFRVLRQEDTERPGSGDLLHEKRSGTFTCAGCGLDLFPSRTKYESGTGWPSFWEPIADDALGRDTDHKLGYARTEVHCARCGGHLGHVFPDGPEPTGLRYCINSVSLDFRPAEGE